ncbi:MAG: TonB-dependent receptor [Bacteroidales bacterium]|nr:TonB-dependent receptor [Bacteroidales bacterium]
MKKIFFILIALLFSIYANSQVITIKSKTNEQPLDLVGITSNKSSAFLTTNSKGEADISVFKGADEIHLQLIGYATVIKSYDELINNNIVFLEMESINMDRIVVSANRSGQSSASVPTKITSIARKDVTLLNPQTAADLLTISGNVFIQKSQQGGGSPMIRGFSTNRLLYTVDGVRMNTAIFRGGNIQNVISLDPFAIENTEVFFGPGSVIYGSDAIGGVMSFQTLVAELSATDEPFITGNATTRYSSANNEKTVHFDVNVGWKKWALLTSISSNDYGDLRMGTNGPEEYLRPFYVIRQDSVDIIQTNNNPLIQKPSGYSQINMMQKLRFKPNHNWDIQYGFHYSETSDYARYDRHIRYKKGLPRYGEWSYGPQIWMMNNLNITNNNDIFLYDQLAIRLAQQYFEESRISRDINDDLRETRTEKVDAYSANIDLSKTIGVKNTIFYGGEFILNNVTSTGINTDISTNVSVPGPSRYPQASWLSYGAYITDKIEFNDKFIIQAGLRYNQYQLDAVFDTTFYPFPFTTANLNDGKFNGSFGFVFRPTKKWIISANAATGFRSPNVDDVGKVFDSEPGSVIVPNPNLKAEYVYSADFGVAKMFGDFIKIDFNVYYTILENALVRRNYTLNGIDSIMYDGTLSQVQAIQNAAVANVYGLQAGFNIKLPSGFALKSDFNYQKGQEELDDGTVSPSRHAPPWFGVTRLSYSTNDLSFQFYSLYSGEKSFEEMPAEEIGKDYMYAIDAEGNPYSPAWFTLNFKTMYKINQNFTVSAGLENITDQRYRPYSSGIVAPGRNLVFSMKAKF